MIFKPYQFNLLVFLLVIAFTSLNVLHLKSENSPKFYFDDSCNSPAIGQNIVPIALQSLDESVYMLLLEDGQQRKTVRLIKQ